MSTESNKLRLLFFPLLLLAAWAGPSCFLGLVPNATDTNNPQGLMNALLVQVDEATGPITTVGGTVTGLSGSGLMIQDTESGEALAISSDGTFAFGTDYAEGTDYAIVIGSQPTGPHQTCTVTGGNGTVKTENVTDVVIACTTNTYTLGGTVTGLAGTGLVLRNNGGDDLAIGANGAFTFATPVASGSTFSVTAGVQPSGPTQTCAVSGGTGTMAGGNVTSVTVNCATNTYTVGGTVTGLVGAGLVLRNNGGDDLAIGANGAFAFATPLNSGSGYNVTVATQPTGPHQTCNVGSGAGTVAATNITTVNITCTTNTYTIGGTVTGLAGGGLTLRNNGGDDLVIGGNGGFAFATPIASGGTYNATLFAQPTSPWQTCNLTGGTGSVVGGNITSISVNCTTNTYTVSGTVSGYAGSGLQLRNGAETLNIGGNGGFAFATPIASGAGYNVFVPSQPNTPWQTCNVTNGTGTMGGANITNVTVTCVTNTYSVGGTVSGLAGTGLVLKNVGGDDLAISSNGAFAFAPAYGSMAFYNVTVHTQPSGPPQTCTVSNPSGTITSSNITNVNINCVTHYTVGGSISGHASTGLQLTLSGAASEVLNVSGGASSYTFTSLLNDGNAYSVAITAQPAGEWCQIVRHTSTIASANATDVNVYCTGPPAATTPVIRALIQNVNIDGQGTVATVTGGSSFNINLNLAVDDSSCPTCVSPVIVSILKGVAPAPSYGAYCGSTGTFTAPAPPVYIPGNGSLTAPVTPGIYLIRAWNSWDFCPNMQSLVSTQGATIGVLIVP